MDSFKGESKLSTWIYRIAWNTAISHARKKRIYLPVKDHNLFASIPDESADELLEKEKEECLLERVEKAIEDLNSEEKLLISLFYLENKTIAEVAEIAGLSAGNAKVKMYRIRKKILALINNLEDEVR